LEAIDCNPKGQIVFDLKYAENKHGIKCYLKTKAEDKYDQILEGPKKFIKFFGSYIIEVKTEKGMDKIQIYDFDNKLSLFNASFPHIFRVEVEKDGVFMLVRDKNGKLVVHQLIEMEHNLKI
jgi:tricorn protease-like protein